MNKLILFALLFTAIACETKTYQAPIDKKKEMTIQMKVGESIVLQFLGNPMKGYGWYIDQLEEKQKKIANVSKLVLGNLLEYDDFNGVFHCNIQAITKGKIQLKFSHQYFFDGSYNNSMTVDLIIE